MSNRTYGVAEERPGTLYRRSRYRSPIFLQGTRRAGGGGQRLSERARRIEARQARHAALDGRAPDSVPVIEFARTRGVDDQIDRARRDGIEDVRRALGNLVDALRDDAVAREKAVRAVRGDERV